MHISYRTHCIRYFLHFSSLILSSLLSSSLLFLYLSIFSSLPYSSLLVSSLSVHLIQSKLLSSYLFLQVWNPNNYGTTRAPWRLSHSTLKPCRRCPTWQRSMPPWNWCRSKKWQSKVVEVLHWQAVWVGRYWGILPGEQCWKYILVPCHVVKSLQLIRKKGTYR